ncbi:autoinducer binding domain-containing protein [Bradyrhizobium sp. NP1]|uniref:autoinducer binding domain-containing protein n=1 Tax=Bradyrhizobium sp. NP1 TaxID=3049772 RepID=UPI003393C1FA
MSARPGFARPGQQLLDEAAQFGIRLGFTVPIHDGHGPIAALTFAADESRPQFERFIASHGRLLHDYKFVMEPGEAKLPKPPIK